MNQTAELYPWISLGAVAWGLLTCFAGFRVFKLTIALFGAFAGGVFGQAAGLALGLGPMGGIGGLVAGALLGGALAYLLFAVAVFAAGFLAGLTLGVLLLASYNQQVAFLSGCVVGVVTGILAVKLQRLVLILGTALLGAFGAIIAAMYFTHRLDWLYYFRDPRQVGALVEGHAWLFPAVLVLAAIGAVAQFELKGSRPAKPKAEKKAPAAD